MIIDNSITLADTNSSKTVACKIEANSVMFELLSARLYQDKVKAVIRELSTNALDSHIEAGNADTPFVVHLPTILEPYFLIRDYGTGMTDEVIFELYSTLGGSSKRESNLFNGALGVGSKAPFAYTQGGSFTLTSFVNGEKSIYSIFSDSGVPSIALLAKVDTTEKNGVEISVPVNIADITKFEVRARDIYSWFKVPPTINKLMEYTDLSNPIIKGDKWQINDNKENPQAIMANVAYPIDATSNDLPMLGIRGLVVFFETGEIQMAGSREGISYTKETLETLRKLESNIQDTIQKNIDKIINDPRGYVYAIQALRKFPQKALELVRRCHLPKYLKSRYGGEVYILTEGEMRFKVPRRYSKGYSKIDCLTPSFFDISNPQQFFIADKPTLTNEILKYYRDKGDQNIIAIIPVQAGAVARDEFLLKVKEFKDKLQIPMPLASELAVTLQLIKPKAKRVGQKGKVQTVASKTLKAYKYVPTETKYSYYYNTAIKENITLFSTDRVPNLVIIPTKFGQVCKPNYEETGKLGETAEALLIDLLNILVIIEHKTEVVFCVVPAKDKNLIKCGTDYVEFFQNLCQNVEFKTPYEPCNNFNQKMVGYHRDYLSLKLPEKLADSINYLKKYKENQEGCIFLKASQVLEKVGVKGVKLTKIELPSKIQKVLDKYEIIFGLNPRNEVSKQRCQRLVDFISKTNNQI